MSIVVTGATGHLGRLVVDSLLNRGVAPERIVAGGRNLAAAAPLAEQGVAVRRIDFEDPASLTDAFAGAERVLIVSGNEFGRRTQQHLAAAAAAQDAGAGLVVYTSAPFADTTSMQLAAEHRATEEGIRALGVPFSFLRNSWYFENYTAQLPTYLQAGAVVGSAGDGRISAAARADYADAAAAVLATGGHENTVYELGGDESFTLTELAELLTKHTGTAVAYRDVPVEELIKILVGAGLPEQAAAVFADVDRAISQGALRVETGELSRLIGRPTTSLSDAVAAAVAASASV